MIRIAIVEDHHDELQGFLHDLSSAEDIEVVATATCAAQAKSLFPAAKPDIVIVDLVLPDSKGSTLIIELRAILPNTSFLVVSAYEDYDRIYSAILSGAVGYLGKVFVQGDLARAIRDVYAGGSPMSSPIARKVLQAFHIMSRPTSLLSKLSSREQEILHILATGRSYKDISESLYISIETVRTHVRNIYRKLQVHSWKDIKPEDLYREGP
jgi:DNA-binding NarL/FixJ family response regulator